jgi:hypothetical protein
VNRFLPAACLIAGVAATLIVGAAGTDAGDTPAPTAPAVQTLNGSDAAPAVTVPDTPTVKTLNDTDPANDADDASAPTVTPEPGSPATIKLPIAQMGPNIVIPPCPTEDSENCYWDAAQRGNGIGTSFIRFDGVTYYPEGTR